MWALTCLSSTSPRARQRRECGDGFPPRGLEAEAGLPVIRELAPLQVGSLVTRATSKEAPAHHPFDRTTSSWGLGQAPRQVSQECKTQLKQMLGGPRTDREQENSHHEWPDHTHSDNIFTSVN